MPLERISTETVREANGFSFLMRVAGTQRDIRVFVADDALGGDAPTSDDGELRVQLETERAALEAVANEKFCRGRVAADDLVTITLSDVVNFIS
jgi:hypothetical protein